MHVGLFGKSAECENQKTPHNGGVNRADFVLLRSILNIDLHIFLQTFIIRITSEC